MVSSMSDNFEATYLAKQDTKAVADDLVGKIECLEKLAEDSEYSTLYRAKLNRLRGRAKELRLDIEDALA